MTPRTRWTFDILKLTQAEDLRAEQDSSIFVHSQDRDRGPARRSSAQDQGPAQLEVIRPNLGPRVEEASTWPVSGSIPDRSVPLNALHRSQARARFRRIVRTAMFSRKDMLDVKRHVRLCRLWEPTVFAAMAGSVTDRPLDGCVHHASATRARRARALAWRMLMKSIASTMSRYSAFSAFVSCPSLHFSASSSMCAWTSGCAQMNKSTRHLGRQALRDRVQQSVYHWRKLLCTHERNISKIPIL